MFEPMDVDHDGKIGFTEVIMAGKRPEHVL